MPLEQLGPYKIGRQIGRGGMGAVYEAVHEQTGQPAAVKVLIQHLAPVAGFRDRFVAEIESLKRLDHPNIVKLFGFGEQEETLFYAMELVPGTSLEEEIRAGRRFLWPEVRQLGLDMAKALKHAHDHGIIHRDIKPANLLLSTDGVVKLSDFGIARLFGNSGMTTDGSLLGTAEYMSPEQAEGRPVTPSCDLYSLGGVLYALLAGRPPFRSKSLPEMLQLQRFSTPEPVSTFAPSVPPEFERIVMRLLEKEPAKRFPDATVLIRQMAALPELMSAAATQSARTAEKLGLLTAADRTRGGLDVTEAPGSLSPDAVTRAADEEIRLAPPTDRTDAGNGAQRTDVDSAARSSADLLLSAASTQSRPTIANFTQVDERSRRASAAPPPTAPAFSWQTVALVVALVGLLVGGWYFTRPLSADRLFDRIQGYAAEGDPERLLDAEDDIRRFLEHYPDDSRKPQVKGYADDLKALRSRRRLQLRAAHASGTAGLLPIEREYLAAMDLASHEPERAAEKLWSLVALYDGANPPDDSAESREATRNCLELAKRELPNLEASIAASAEEQGRWLDQRLQQAAALQAENPAAARAIWKAVIELYGDKPWAAERVERARKALENQK